MSLEEQVLEVMKKNGEPMKSGDIAKILGVDTKEVSKAIKKLKAEGKIESPKRCYYAPKS
ncbi:MAG: HTH domain-containing protein [Epsilonproteobacteria bacterium]|nr:HTH domain-containing protein [Campylobacterota bacterium]